jgi:hypothetical protein
MGSEEPGEASVRRRWTWRRRLVALGVTWLIAGVLLLLLVEAIYRWQLVDSYGTELRTFNPPSALAETDRPTLLIMGDSLTAGRGSYPDLLRVARPDLRVVNAGLPGTGLVQAQITAPHRFRTFRPAYFVYQLNVRNDLLNLRWPVAWGRLSLARNLYWTLAERFRSMEFVNYRLGQLRFRLHHQRTANGEAPLTVSGVAGGPSACEWRHEAIDVAAYGPRSRFLVEAWPDLVEQQVLLEGVWRETFQELLDRLPQLLGHCDPADCRAWLLVVPDAIQVDARYVELMERMGGTVKHPEAVLGDEPPFLAGLRDWAEGQGDVRVRIVDPLAALRRLEEQGRRAYYALDPHLNACGQEILGQQLLEALEHP